MLIEIKEKNKQVSEPGDVWKIALALLKAEDEIDQDKEHFWVFHLDSGNIIKMVELISLGTLNSSLVHPREVYTRAVRERTAQIVCCHNHPTDNVEPSEDDLEITSRLKKSGEILGIELIDHLVISSKGFTSLKERGRL